MEKFIARGSLGRMLFYHPESDSYVCEILPFFENSVDESKWWEERSQLDQVTEVDSHENRFMDQRFIGELKSKIQELEGIIKSLYHPDLSAEGRILIQEDLKRRLPDTFRSHFPMYQFFRELGPLEAFAVTQSQMQIDNINLGVTAVFLFKDEADMAAKWMKDRDTKGLSFKVLPTRITQFKGF